MAVNNPPTGHLDIDTISPRKEQEVRRMLFDMGMKLLSMSRSDDLMINARVYADDAADAWTALHASFSHLEMLDEITRPSGSRGSRGRGMLPSAPQFPVVPTQAGEAYHNGTPATDKPGINAIAPIRPAGWTNELAPRDDID